MDKEIAMALGEIKERMNDLGKRIDNYYADRNNERKAEIEAITPYTETKTAYIGDAEIVFYDVPEGGNITVFFPYEDSMERMHDRIIITFEPLEEVTDITISIL
jgi:hypothetical protein